MTSFWHGQNMIIFYMKYYVFCDSEIYVVLGLI